jgi:D-alanyl-D-alanine dipeptidase
MFAVTSSNAGPSKKKPGARGKRLGFQLFRNLAASSALLLFAFSTLAQSADSLLTGPKPFEVTPQWKAFIGDYDGQTGTGTLILLERDGNLFLQSKQFGEIALRERGKNDFAGQVAAQFGFSLFLEEGTLREGHGDVIWNHHRLDYAPHPPATAAADVESLRKTALASAPPEEKGPFRKPDLVELAQLNPAIHLDVRYATANDFLGVPVYTQARAFLQRPAGEALIRALHKLQPLGYGLLIHDGYRPWYVTKIFWDATPAEGKIFVADPAQGSRHNRGCAVDLTLYDLKTDQPIEMTGAYDEMSPRSFPNYPGGTSLQRWHRDLLRRAMESEGFTVYEAEWWHFDYKDWHEYGILNIPFEKLGIGSEQK